MFLKISLTLSAKLNFGACRFNVFLLYVNVDVTCRLLLRNMKYYSSHYDAYLSF